MADRDPSGHFVQLLAMVASYLKVSFDAYVGIVGLAGMIDAAIAGGSAGDIIMAEMSSAAFASIGASLGGGFRLNWRTVEFAGASGIIGGMTTAVSGGKFGHGFKNASIGAVAGGLAARHTNGVKGDLKRFVAKAALQGEALNRPKLLR